VLDLQFNGGAGWQLIYRIPLARSSLIELEREIRSRIQRPIRGYSYRVIADIADEFVWDLDNGLKIVRALLSPWPMVPQFPLFDSDTGETTWMESSDLRSPTPQELLRKTTGYSGITEYRFYLAQAQGPVFLTKSEAIYVLTNSPCLNSMPTDSRIDPQWSYALAAYPDRFQLYYVQLYNYYPADRAVSGINNARTVEGARVRSERNPNHTYYLVYTPSDSVVISFKAGEIVDAPPCPHAFLSPISPVAAPESPEFMPNTPGIEIPRHPDMMAKIGITRCKTTNKLLLSVDAKPLHDLLDSIGCAVDAENAYKDRPSASFSTVERETISTELLLRRQYPTTISLSGIYRTPPSIQQLRDLCGSAHAQIRKILQHYQPIDISVTINKKIL